MSIDKVYVRVPHLSQPGRRSEWLMSHLPRVGDSWECGDTEYWGKVEEVTWVSGDSVEVRVRPEGRRAEHEGGLPERLLSSIVELSRGGHRIDRIIINPLNFTQFPSHWPVDPDTVFGVPLFSDRNVPMDAFRLEIRGPKIIEKGA
jgi:hypothetical protein